MIHYPAALWNVPLCAKRSHQGAAWTEVSKQELTLDAGQVNCPDCLAKLAKRARWVLERCE